MGRILPLASVLLLGVGVALAQQGAAPPPSDYGIGNSKLAPNSSVSNSPSFSPDQNNAITNDRGTTTGDKYPNPAFAGYSGQKTASAGNSQGAVGATGSTAATAGRRLPKRTPKSTRAKNKPQNGSAKGKSAGSARQGTSSKPAGQSVIPSEQGPSTTEAPGPSTGVPGAKLPRGGKGNYSGTSSTSSGPGK